jgi:hypothetical protein
LAGINDSQIKPFDVKALFDLNAEFFKSNDEEGSWKCFDNRDSRSLLMFNHEFGFVIFAKF